MLQISFHGGTDAEPRWMHPRGIPRRRLALPRCAWGSRQPGLRPITRTGDGPHYEVGIRVGELSLPPGFDGLLVWGRIYNRPFLRCLHGYGLCLWRLGKLAEARRVFERILSLDPNDNQGVRFCWEHVRDGGSWEAMRAREKGEHVQATAALN